jgi:acyl-CoA thioester hydrolase
MKEFIKEIQMRWSDLDPNYHLRHSIYYDWGAFCRVEFFKESGFTTQLMQQLHFGPILLGKNVCSKKRSGMVIK